MASKSERTKRKRIKLVGGGFRYNRESAADPGGSAKSMRRAARKAAKKERNPAVRKARLAAIRRNMKEQIRATFLAKNAKNAST